MALTVIGIDIATLSVPLSAAMLGFAGFTILLTLAAGLPIMRSSARTLDH
jgi:hypothetical protein